MRRLNVVFVAIVVGAVLAGGVAAAGFGTELRTVDTISLVRGQLDTTVDEVVVGDEAFEVTVEVRNPTGYAIALQGTFVRVFQDSPTQLAYGAGERLDDGSATVPARGSLTARYRIGLTPEQAERLRNAAESGPLRLTVFHSLELEGESFEFSRTNVTITAEVEA